MFTPRSQTILVGYSTVRCGKRDVCKQCFISPQHAAPISASTVCSEQQVWCVTLRCDISKYSCGNSSKEDAVSLQVVQCSAEGDMLSAESVGGMSTWTFFGDIPLLSAAEVFEVNVIYVQGGQKEKKCLYAEDRKD